MSGFFGRFKADAYVDGKRVQGQASASVYRIGDRTTLVIAARSVDGGATPMPAVSASLSDAELSELLQALARSPIPDGEALDAG